MLTINAHDFYYLAPEICLTVWGLVVLMADFALLRRQTDRRRQVILGWLSLAGVAVTLGVMAWLSGLYFSTPAQRAAGTFNPDPVILFGTVSGDILTFWMNLLIVLLLAMVIAMSMAWSFTKLWGEYFALLFWSGVGMMFLVAAEELLTLFLTLEMMTICLYLATAFETGRRRSAEGGLKYFIYGSVSSALFLFGLSLIYGLTGTTRLDAIRTALFAAGGPLAGGLEGNVVGATAVLLVLVGFGFKISAVPFHQWAPDAYEGAPAPVTAWIATGSKLASFVALMKVLVSALGPWAQGPDHLTSPGWVGIVALISAVTMTFGNVAALAQRNFKRMLAYSSIAHAGYMLVGVLAASISLNRGEAAGSVLFYLVIYGFTTVAAFAVAAWLARDTERDDIDDLNGLGFRSPGLAVCIVLLMLSLIGMPPFAGFFGKLYMFMEALRTDETNRVTMIGLVALGFINSLISAFYYVRVLKAMFLRDEGPQPAQEAPAGVRWPILVGAVVAVGFGVFPQTLVKTASAAATMMLSGGVGIHDTPSPVAVLSPPAVPAGRPTADAAPDQANHQAGAAAEVPVATPPEPRPAP